jgi:hypothetical protein
MLLLDRHAGKCRLAMTNKSTSIETALALRPGAAECRY